jgi:predicted XRE-type DNA-binding protein
MSTIVKEPKRKSVPTSKSIAFKEQLRVGGEISIALPQKMSQSQVARSLGISQQMVSRIERQALFKLRHALLNNLGLSGAEITKRDGVLPSCQAKTLVVGPPEDEYSCGE